MSDTTSGGLFGMSPDFARNLLTFGASTMAAANARGPGGWLTYGAGPLGPVGAGLMGMQQQGMDQARLQSNLALQNAQLQHMQAETDLLRPQALYMQQAVQGQLGQQPAPDNPFSFVPPGGFGNQSQSSPGGNVVPPQQREMMARNAVKGTPVPAELQDAQVQVESGWNPEKPGAAGEIGLGQIKPSTAQDPGYGVPGIDPAAITGARNGSNNLTFNAQYMTGLGNKLGMKPEDWSDQQKLTRVLSAYNTGSFAPSSAGDAYAQKVLGQMRKGPSWGPQPYQVAQAGNGPMPMPGQLQGPVAPGQSPMQLNIQGQGPAPGGYDQQAMAMARYYYDQAAQLRPLNIGSLGDQNAARRAALMQQAKSWEDMAMTAPKAQAQQQAEVGAAWQKPITTREGIFDPRTGKTIYRNPQLVKGVDPKTGAEYWTWQQFDEGPNGKPDNTGATMAALPPGQHTALEQTAHEFNSEPAIKQYNGAIQTIGWTRTMEDDFDRLNNTGDAWSKTGPGADTRLHIASTMNSGLRAMGLPEAFNPEKIASWEALNKQTRTAGMQLVSSMFGGQKEAASIVHSAIGAVPGIENSPDGAKLITAIIRQGAQYQIDRRAYIQQQAGPGGANVGDYTSPGLDFDAKGNTLKQYMTRAISEVRPYKLVSKTPQEFAASGEARKYLPGTLVQSPSGSVFQVPEPAQSQ